MRKALCLLFILALILMSSSVYSQEANIPVNKDITIGVLKNGIKYYILKNKKPENRAELRLVVNAGSILEDENQKGLAHFVEHMAFNGSSRFKKNELVDYLESVGVKFGPDLNAYTSFDETVYMLQTPTDKPELVDKGFLVLEDWAHGLAFNDEEIDKERGVITEEWRLGRGAYGRMRDKQFPIIFQNSKYADRLPIGDINIVKSCEHKLLKKFYKDWYRPDLMAVIAVGDFDKNDIETLIKKHFENIEPSKESRTRELFPVPGHKETLFAIATDKEAMGSSVALYMKKPIERIKTINDYRNQMITSLFSQMLNERLEELTQLADPPFINGYAGKGNFVRTEDVNYLYAMVKDGGVEKGLETILREAERARQFGFTATEFDRAKKNVIRSLEKALAEKDKQESGTLISQLVSNFLSESPITGIENSYELNKKMLPGITLDEVNKAAAELILPDNRVVVVTAPEKEGLKTPTKEDLTKILDKVKNEKITAYVDNAKDAPLVKNLPKASSITEYKKHDKLGLTEWKLANGARVFLKNTDFKNDQILFSAFSYGGSSLVDDKEYFSTQFASSIARESGIGAFNNIELTKALTGKIANVSPWIGDITEGFGGSCSPVDATTMFQLIYLNFTNPRFDSVAAVSLKAKYKAYLENMRNEPEVVFEDTVENVLNDYHFRSMPLTVSTIDGIDYKTSEKIFKELFNDAGKFTFVFVGNIDTNIVKPLVLQYIGGLPGKNSGETFRDINITHPKGFVEKTIYKGIEPKSSVELIYTGDFSWSRDEEYKIESLIDALDIRLREVIREDKGGAYGVDIRQSIEKMPKQKYQITVEFGCDPKRVDELTKAAFAVIDSMKQFGPNNELVAKVKAIQKREHEKKLKENSYWKGIIYAYLVNKDELNQILDYPTWNENLKAEDIKTEAVKYFGDNCLKFVLYPEAKK
jgi:zinc protease